MNIGILPRNYDGSNILAREYNAQIRKHCNLYLAHRDRRDERLNGIYPMAIGRKEPIFAFDCATALAG
jgi:hypothetical protein